MQGDHLGSTSTLTNGSGAVVARERYSAFGERRRGETYLVTDQLYTGQRLNVLSNLYHYSDGTSAGRFYDPLLARFVQADSVTPGNTSIALNRYAYANNSPVVFTDPSGHAAWVDTEGPAYETHEQLIDAVGGIYAPPATVIRWTGIYSEAYPDYCPPASETNRNFGYRFKVMQWQDQKEQDAAIAAEAGIDWASVGPKLLRATSLAFGFAASNGGDDGSRGLPGEFSIVDWTGYPTAGNVPRPEGPFRMLEGEEYNAARDAANQANRTLHRQDPTAKGLEFHETQPVKFGGSPTDPNNKVLLPPAVHIEYTRWWNGFRDRLSDFIRNGP